MEIESGFHCRQEGSPRLPWDDANSTRRNSSSPPPRHKSPGHPFFKALNAHLAEAGFATWLKRLCLPYYEREETRGQPSIPPRPGVYFRMLFVGYFEGIDSHRGIVWRRADSRSLERYLGLDPDEETPDHSSLTRILSRSRSITDREQSDSLDNSSSLRFFPKLPTRTGVHSFEHSAPNVRPDIPRNLQRIGL